MTLAASTRYCPAPATSSSLRNCCKSDLLSCTPASSARSLTTCSCRLFTWLEDEPPPEMTRATVPVPFSAPPKTATTAPRIPSSTEFEPSEYSSAISASETTSNTPRTSRVRRVSRTPNHLSCARHLHLLPGEARDPDLASAWPRAPALAAVCRSPPRTCRYRAQRSQADCR